MWNKCTSVHILPSFSFPFNFLFTMLKSWTWSSQRMLQFRYQCQCLWPKLVAGWSSSIVSANAKTTSVKSVSHPWTKAVKDQSHISSSTRWGPCGKKTPQQAEERSLDLEMSEVVELLGRRLAALVTVELQVAAVARQRTENSHVEVFRTAIHFNLIKQKMGNTRQRSRGIWRWR